MARLHPPPRFRLSFAPPSAHPSIPLCSHRSIFSYYIMSSVTIGPQPEASKALSSFLSRPRVPTAFTEVAYLGVPSHDLEPLNCGPSSSPPLLHKRCTSKRLM